MTTHTTRADIISRLQAIRAEVGMLYALYQREGDGVQVAYRLGKVRSELGQISRDLLFAHIDTILSQRSIRARKRQELQRLLPLLFRLVHQ
jgi:hypothetical protein